MFSEQKYPLALDSDNICAAEIEEGSRSIKSDFVTIENFPGDNYAEKFKRMVSVGVVYTVIAGNKDL